VKRNAAIEEGDYYTACLNAGLGQRDPETKPIHAERIPHDSAPLYGTSLTPVCSKRSRYR
jgi:hypothetical protein